MEQRSSTDSFSLKERIRDLGFDPEHLTPEEQVELLTLHLSLQGAEPGGKISASPAQPHPEEVSHHPGQRRDGRPASLPEGRPE